jgi:hypothetical protein
VRRWWRDCLQGSAEPLREGAWCRALRDTRDFCLSLPFLLVDVLVAAVVGKLAAWWFGPIGFFGLIALVFIAMSALAPIRQRNEARSAAAEYHGELNPEFPRHKLTVDRMWHADLPGITDEQTRVLFVPISFTNREPSRRVSLQFDLLWTRVSGDQALGPYKLYSYGSDDRITEKLPKLLVTPLSVQPETTREGYLLFAADLGFIFDFSHEVAVSMKAGFALTLRLTDYVTGATVEYPVPGAQT